jgi:cytidine deaminase
VVSDAPHPVSPCGYCRQFLAEFGLDLEVVSVGSDGRRATWTLRDLLPDAFTGADIVEGT